MNCDERRFLRKLCYDDTTGCVVFMGARDRKGYGSFHLGRRQIRAHRFSYERFCGPIQATFEIDHLCGNPSCVHLEHLESVPKRVNILRSRAPSARNARKTHCDYGHLLDGANTYLGPDGSRQCKRCRNRRAKEAYRAAREAAGYSVGLPSADRTHCPVGHRLTVTRRGRRECMLCNRTRTCAHRIVVDLRAALGSTRSDARPARHLVHAMLVAPECPARADLITLCRTFLDRAPTASEVLSVRARVIRGRNTEAAQRSRRDRDASVLSHTQKSQR